MKEVNRKGLSPVIATVLLISVALVLAVVVFLWARSVVGESVEKNGRAAELSCEEVAFRAEAYNRQLFIQNIGNIPIYAFETRLVGEGEITKIEQSSGTISAGQTVNFSLEDATVGDELVIVPILIGETDTELVPVVCDDNYGVDITVTA